MNCIPEKMKALVLRAAGDFDIETVDVPECPEKGILVKVTACGLCGSDLRTLYSGRKNMRYPWIIGHEVAAEVVLCGPSCTAPFKKGDMLAAAPVVYCGSCDFCMEGKFEFCDRIREIAIDWHGGFAEYMAIPPEALARGTIRPVPPGMNPVYAAVAEPLSSCLHAQERGNVGMGDTVAVIGCGPIGCAHTGIAKARGARTVIAADVSPERLQMCRSFGADILVNSEEEDTVEAVLRHTGGKGPGVVITANPVPKTQIEAVEMAGKGARILLFGGLPPNDSKPGIDTNLIHYRGLQLIGTTTFAPRHHIMALSMIESGRFPMAKFVTHVLPLDRVREGVRLAREGKALKVVFTF
ncbi:MAG: alcohol dehydrogenase catalytic domain-containing protein [Treponema sp.]|jgi:L-iditol 2-dehydrogenase|nr:alcohol dehydrogenase catalytic domain-containing protein [Treponema sp.]